MQIMCKERRPKQEMKCPGCNAIMLVTKFKWINEKAGWYYMKEVCSVCRVIRQVTMNLVNQK